MIAIPWKFLQEQLNLKENTIQQITKELNYLGLETTIKILHEEYLEFTPFSNRTDLNSWQNIIDEISNITNYKKTLFLNSTDSLSSQENKFSNKFLAEPYNIKIKIKPKKQYTKLFLLLLENIEIKESTKTTQETLFVNKIKSFNNIVDSLSLIKLKFGGSFFIVDFNEKIEKITINYLAKENQINTKKNKNIDLKLNGEEVFFYFKKGEDNKKKIMVGCIFFFQNIKNTEIIQSISHFLTTNKKIKIKPLIYKENKKKQKNFTINKTFIEKKIGKVITKEELESILKKLEYPFFLKTKKMYKVQVPLQRPDITSKEELITEIRKTYCSGVIFCPSRFVEKKFFLHNFKETEEDLQEKKRRVLRTILINNGWQEIITYSLIPEETINIFKEKTTLSILKNKKKTFFRKNLIASHLTAIQHNISLENINLFFFEISTVFDDNFFSFNEVLTLTTTGNIIEDHFLRVPMDFCWLKGTLKALLRGLNLQTTFSSPLDFKKNDFLEEENKKTIMVEKEEVGFIGRIKKNITTKYKINSQTSLWITQLSLTKIYKHKKKETMIKSSSEFPINKRELSFFLPDNTDCEQVLSKIEEMQIEELLETRITDVFQDEKLKKNKQFSFTFQLIFQGKEKTLKKEEVEIMITKISQKIEKELKGKLRIK